MEPIHLKLDTGADVSTLSKTVLHDLGYDKNWIAEHVLSGDKYSLKTASGEVVKSGFIQLPIVNILGMEVKNWPFAILLDDDNDLSNLIGRDLLAGFNYRFNNDDEVLEIEHAKSFVYIWKQLEGQEVNEVRQ